MPLYPFTCSDCGAEFEALVTRPTADPKAECPSCGGPQVDPRTWSSGPAGVGRRRTNCRGDGPPCGAPWCGRTRNAQPVDLHSARLRPAPEYVAVSYVDR